VQLVTSKEIAKAFGVTRGHITNLVKAGMPVAQRGGNAKGGKTPDLFDLEICKAWRAAQAGLSTAEDETKLDQAVGPASEQEESYRPSDERIAQLSKLSLVELKHRKLATEIAKEEELARGYKIKADRELGQLVSIEEVRGYVSRLYGLVRGRLDALPASENNALAALTDPDEVYQRLENWVQQVRADLADDLSEVLVDGH